MITKKELIEKIREHEAYADLRSERDQGWGTAMMTVNQWINDLEPTMSEVPSYCESRGHLLDCDCDLGICDGYATPLHWDIPAIHKAIKDK